MTINFPQQTLELLSNSQKDYKEKTSQFLAFGHLFGNNVGLTLSQSFCIGGKPALTADGIWGRVIESGNLRFKWTHLSNEKVTLYALRKDMSDNDFKCDIEYTLTVQEAKSAGYARGMGWSKFPQQMLMARCKTFVARALFSEVVGGLYAVEELDSNDSQQFQALNEQPIRQPSTPPPFVPPPVQKKTEQSRPVEPVEPSQPPVQTPPPPPPVKRFSKSAAQDPSQLMDMLVKQQIIDHTLGSNKFKTVQVLYKQMILTRDERIRFARLCVESRECFLLACSLGLFTLSLDDAAKWNELPKDREASAQSIADKYGYVDDPATYFGKIFHDVGGDDDMHEVKSIT